MSNQTPAPPQPLSPKASKHNQQSLHSPKSPKSPKLQPQPLSPEAFTPFLNRVTSDNSETDQYPADESRLSMPPPPIELTKSRRGSLKAFNDANDQLWVKKCE